MLYLAEHTRHELSRAITRLREAIYTPMAELRMTAWVTKEPVPFAKRNGPLLHKTFWAQGFHTPVLYTAYAAHQLNIKVNRITKISCAFA